jgi:hypothetical protein
MASAMDRASAHPLEEYKIICEMMRSCALLRFYQFVCVWLTSVFLPVGAR